LGYTQANWDNPPPASADKNWAQLTDSEKAAGGALGYTARTWDNEPGKEPASSSASKSEQPRNKDKKKSEQPRKEDKTTSEKPRKEDKKKSEQPRNEDTKKSPKYSLSPHPSRAGLRCAMPKRKIGNDLLAVVATVPIGAFDFEMRKYIRKYLSAQAHKLRSRRYYRKITTSSEPKRYPRFDVILKRVDWLRKLYRGVSHKDYTISNYGWDWNLKEIAQPVEDVRAVCVDVIFAVGMTPSQPDTDKWEKLATEALTHNDIVIGPYLDGRGKGKAMTQKTVQVLWWSAIHLSWADHVFKVDTDTFVNFTRLVQVLPPPTQNMTLQWIGVLHDRFFSEGYGPSCVNGEMYGFSRPLLQRLRPLLDTPAHVDFFLRNPVHIMFHLDLGGLRNSVPYSLRFPEDFVACSLVTQAAIGVEDRFEDFVLERPDYFPMWAHALKTEGKYSDCALGRCKGQPREKNHMPDFDKVKLLSLSDYIIKW